MAAWAHTQAARDTAALRDLQAETKRASGYTPEEYAKLCGDLLRKLCGVPRDQWQSDSVHEALMLRGMFMATHGTLSRGGEVRRWRYMCASVEEVKQRESENAIEFFSFVSNDGKENCDGHILQTYITSHRRWELDPIGALFALLHWEWDTAPRLRGELPAPMLDCSERVTWYRARWFHPRGALE